jgi:hypothetical protein
MTQKPSQGSLFWVIVFWVFVTLALWSMFFGGDHVSCPRYGDC